MTKPLNADLLWKSKFQRAAYPNPVLKKPMILPEINWLTGKPVAQDIHKKMLQGYADYSMKYWQGVKQRAALYRLKANAVSTVPRAESVVNTQMH